MTKRLKPGKDGQVLKLKLPKRTGNSIIKLLVTGETVEVHAMSEYGEPESGWEYPVEIVKQNTDEK